MQKQRITENLYPFGDMSGLAHHMSAVDDEGRGNIAPYLCHCFDDFRSGGMFFSHGGGIQYDQAHAAGEVSGVQHGDIFKGFCRFQGIVISVAGMLCHGDVDHVLSFCQLLCEELFIVCHFRRL